MQNIDGKSLYALIIDKDDVHVKSITETLPIDHKSIFTSDIKEACQLINDSALKLVTIFIGQELERSDWQKLILLGQRLRPHASLIHLLSNGKYWRINEEEVNKLKNVKLHDLNDAVGHISTQFDLNSIREPARPNEVVGAIVPGSDEDFHAIDLNHFITGNKSLFDIYVKLKLNKKFIKAINAMEPFSKEKIESFETRGHAKLYLRKDSTENYIKYSTNVTESIMNSESIPMEYALCASTCLGSQLLGYIQKNLNEDSIQHVHRYVKNTKKLVGKIEKLNCDEFPNGLFSQLIQCDHAISALMITGLISGKLDIESSKAYELVALSAFLHDIGLEPPLMHLDSGDLSTALPEEKAAFEAHPEASAKKLSRLKSIDASVIQAIKQHHMRLTGYSFPDRAPNAPINWVAQVIGLADEIAHAIHYLSSPEGMGQNRSLSEYLEQAVYPKFSRKIVYAARMVLTQKSTTN